MNWKQPCVRVCFFFIVRWAVSTVLEKSVSKWKHKVLTSHSGCFAHIIRTRGSLWGDLRVADEEEEEQTMCVCEMWQYPASFMSRPFPCVFLFGSSSESATLTLPSLHTLLNDNWQNFLNSLRASLLHATLWGQLCTLIRLSSMELITLLSLSLLFFAPLVTLFFFLRLSPCPGPPPWLLWLSLSWGYICFQQLYSLLFTGRSAGWGPHNNKALTLNLPPSVSWSLTGGLCVAYPPQPSEWLVEGAEVGGRTLLSVEMRRKNPQWVLFLCDELGVSLRGKHGRRTVGFAAAWPLSNCGLIRFWHLCSTFSPV